MNTPSMAAQLVNFCSKPLTKLVECTSICADDHQVENLISQHAFQRQKGFRVERFIRPPVHLYFHFLVPVDIGCVAIKPDLTEGAEVNLTVFLSHSSQQQQQQQQQQQMKVCGRGSVKGEGAVLVMKNRVFERRHQCTVELSMFPDILASYMNQTDTVCVSEDLLKDVSNVRCLKLSVNYFSGPRPVSLKWVEVWGTLGTSTNRDGALTAGAAISNLMRTRSDGGGRVAHFVSSPGGGPRDSLFCQPQEDKQNYNGGEEKVSFMLGTTSTHAKEKEQTGMLREKQLSVFTPSQPQPCGGTTHVSAHDSYGDKLFTSSDSCDSTNQSSVALSSDGSALEHTAISNADRDRKAKKATVAIPDRFLDEITYEIMALPMLLPSGHCVDRSTLDKLQHTDSIYGRPPSDPFTGVAFSEHVQPQFSVQLKQQIDSFLSTHTPPLCLDKAGVSSFGRTLGSASEIAKHLCSIDKQVKKRGREEVENSSKRAWVPVAKKHKQLVITTPTTPAAAGAGAGGKGTSKGWTSATAGSSSHNHSTSSTSWHVKEGQDRGCLEAHELNLASSLDKELQDLLRS